MIDDIIQARSFEDMAILMLEQAGSTPEGDSTDAELATGRALAGIGWALLHVAYQLARSNDISEGL